MKKQRPRLTAERGSIHRSIMKPLVALILMVLPVWADGPDAATNADLRPEFERLHLTPRTQGARPTCSVFAVTQALEFAVARQNAAQLLPLGLSARWIKKWNVHTGLSHAEFETLRATLNSGSPVCGGFRWPKTDAWQHGIVRMCRPEEVFDGHSVLLIGYQQDPAQPGGGLFLIRDSATGGDRHMPFAYAKEFMNDALWFAPR